MGRQFRSLIKIKKTNMNYFSIFALINLVLACKYSMDLEERARVCANCRDKSVIARKTAWAQMLFREVCYQLKTGGCCSGKHFNNLQNPKTISRAMNNRIH